MSAYDAFLVELFQYTQKDTLKALSYEDLSRATNKVCKQIYGAKPTEDQKKEQANIKRKVKMEWKKENETEEGVIKTSMYEEKAEVKEEYAEQVAELHAEAEKLAEKVKSKSPATEVTEEHVEALAGALRYSGTETDLKAEQAVEELRKIAAEKYKKEQATEEIAVEEKHEEEIELPCHFGGFDFSGVREQAQLKEAELVSLLIENQGLKLANEKLHGLIDGLCLGSSLVLSGLLVVMLLYKLL